MSDLGEPASHQTLEPSLGRPQGTPQGLTQVQLQVQLQDRSYEQQIADLRVRLQMQRQLIALKLVRSAGKRRFRYPRSTVMRFLMRHPTMTLNLLTRLATMLVNATVLRPRKTPHVKADERAREED